MNVCDGQGNCWPEILQETKLPLALSNNDVVLTLVKGILCTISQPQF